MPDGWNIHDEVGDQGVLNPDLSKNATYNYYNHQVDLALRWVREKMQLNAGVSFQPQSSTLTYQKGEYNVDTSCLQFYADLPFPV